ncbi:uncharacterized protein LOC110850049 [Folsomia candida]|uniref:Uncharacterized protein n=1 Tax=Folsomia candida TaxID=158441 RepID=A0A226E7H3_FOLCA|nr:uncharacterized protein LOC110850049 [Folsomia candida]OXA53553.1 hypothetical protein Fcan01_10549 [Folsomia candida]
MKIFPPMCLLGICNLFLGPIIIVQGILPELSGYLVKLNANEDIMEIVQEYVPVFVAHFCMVVCCVISGICAISTSCLGAGRSVITFAKVANFFSKLLVCLVVVFIFYNWDPMDWRTWDGFPRTWGSISLPTPTCFYCFVVQFCFVILCTQLITEKQNEAQNVVTVKKVEKKAGGNKNKGKNKGQKRRRD